MARPQKKGLDYFPLDVDFFADEKIEAISGEFGIKGEICVIKLLCAIYKNGYFIQWSELQKMKLLKSLPGISPELLDSIIKRLILWGFFDQTLFDSAAILTSRAIQERYFEAAKRRKDLGELPFLIINVDNNRVNVYNNPINVDINTQRKGKEIKGKKISTDVDKKIANTDEVIDVEKGESIIFSDIRWLESLASNLSLSKEELSEHYSQFIEHRRSIGRHEDTAFEIKSHFKNWLKKQQSHGNTDKRTASSAKNDLQNIVGLHNCREESVDI